MVRTKSVDEHVGAPLHFYCDLELNKLGLGHDCAVIFAPKKGLIGTTISTLLNFFAYGPACEKFVAHLHAVQALIWIAVVFSLFLLFAE